MRRSAFALRAHLSSGSSASPPVLRQLHVADEPAAWRAAGFSLGFAPALFSDRALFLTVEAVETFVEVHYQEQIKPLKQEGRCPQLVALLEHCCADEVHHKEDAAARSGGEGDTTGRTLLEQSWVALVQWGSAVAAECARRV